MPADADPKASPPVARPAANPFTVEHPTAEHLVVKLRAETSMEFWRHTRAYDWLEHYGAGVTVDLQDAPVITSVFAGWLVGLVRAAAPVRVTLTRCTPRVRDILALLRIDLMVDIDRSTAR